MRKSCPFLVQTRPKSIWSNAASKATKQIRNQLISHFCYGSFLMYHFQIFLRVGLISLNFFNYYFFKHLAVLCYITKQATSAARLVGRKAGWQVDWLVAKLLGSKVKAAWLHGRLAERLLGLPGSKAKVSSRPSWQEGQAGSKAAPAARPHWQQGRTGNKAAPTVSPAGQRLL